LYYRNFILAVFAVYRGKTVHFPSVWAIQFQPRVFGAFNDYTIDYSLDNLQKTVDPDKFFRINRNCIININEISDILNYSSNRLKIKLKSNKPIYDFIVSKDKVSEFKKWIDK